MLIGYVLGALLLFGFILMMIVGMIILLSIESMTWPTAFDPEPTTAEIPPVEIAP